MSLAKCLSQNSLSSRAKEVGVSGPPRCNKRNEAQNAIKFFLFPFLSQPSPSLLEISPMAIGAIQSASKYANHMSSCNSFLMVRFLRNANRTKIACSQRLKKIQLGGFQAYYSFLTKLGIGSSIFSLYLSFVSNYFLTLFALVIWPEHEQGLSLSSLINLSLSFLFFYF